MTSGGLPWAEMNFEHPMRALYHIGAFNFVHSLPLPQETYYARKHCLGNSDQIPAIPKSLGVQGTDFVKQVGVAFIYKKTTSSTQQSDLKSFWPIKIFGNIS